MIRKIFTISFIVFFISCSSEKPLLDDVIPNTGTNTDDVEQTTDNPLNTTVSNYNAVRYQSTLSDTYIYKSNEIPEAFARLKVESEEDESEQNLYEGYRVQIYSGQDVALADSAAMKFRAWSDTTIVGYQAETYTFFKAPYYRVHVGDFHDRDLANHFSNLLKRRFRDSWVVYDQVDPWRVPSDTTYIYIE